jgi:serine/threonine-protein kinase
VATNDRGGLGDAVTLAATVASAAGGTIDPAPKLAERYELLGLLGTGGMGAVYRVRDTELGEVVALKMLHSAVSRDERALERFRSEVRLARRVTHRNVARTFDIGDHRGEKFLTMEWVDGGSLAARIAERGPLVPADIIAIAAEICAGLAAAHRAGVVHRDLKPENVLLASDGRVVVTDFGIAHTGDRSESTIIGTPAYMAPEQLVPGSAIDHSADIYALGAVIFEMLTGDRAWEGDLHAIIEARQRDGTAPDACAARPGVDPQLAAIAARCMAVEPAARFGDANAVARSLAAIEVSTTTATVTPRMPTPSRAGTTIAVLPFAYEGPDADRYLADALSGDLIDTLSMTRGLVVRPRAVVARVDRGTRGFRELGRDLAVDVIVEGTVQRIGDRIRVGVRVIGSDDEFQLFAHRVDTTLDQLLVTLDASAHAIADALATKLPARASAPPTDPAAIELYLRARRGFWHAWSNSAAEAVEQLERALALAPNDPRILSGTAQALTRMLFFGEGDRNAVMARARELTARAVEVAPDVGDGWASLAAYRLNAGDIVGAAQAAQTGLTHAPQSAMLQDYLGRLLAETTPLDEACTRLQIALELDPTLASARVERSRVLALLGRWDEAAREHEATDYGPNAGSAPRAHSARLALWRGVLVRDVSSPPNTYARLYGELDRDTGLTPAQREFLTTRAGGASGRIRVLLLQRNVEIFAFMGDVDDAFAALGDAVDGGLIDHAWMSLCPVLAVVRDDPRFAAPRATVAERADRIRDALRGTRAAQ